MAGVAQLVRASGCGSEGRGFDSRHSPHISYFSLKNTMTNSELEILFMPSLLELLILSENNKGVPLTEEEVLNICSNAIGIFVSKDRAVKFQESRGYIDINPENCWVEWQFYKNNSNR